MELVYLILLALLGQCLYIVLTSTPKAVRPETEWRLGYLLNDNVWPATQALIGVTIFIILWYHGGPEAAKLFGLEPNGISPIGAIGVGVSFQMVAKVFQKINKK